MRRKLILALGVSCLCVTAARGFFGLGVTVFDPWNLAEAINQVRQLEQQFHQMVETYRMVRNQYEHMTYMARQVPVNMAARYRAAHTPWRTSSASDLYGASGGWIAGINTGSGVADGYRRAVEALNSYGAAMSRVPADQVERLKKYYATVELADGANLHTLETLGTLRRNAPAVESAIQGLEDDSLSGTRDMNTEIAVLNKINAATVIALRNSQDTNKLLVTLAEQQTIDAKRRRDSEAQAINTHIRFMAEGREFLASQKADATTAMLAYRLP